MPSLFPTIQKPVVLPSHQPVTISYHDLLNGKADLNRSIENAFGRDGLGLILIKDYPELKQKRQRILKISHQFASLPEHVKAKYIDEKSMYAYGWSHGVEKLASGKTDTQKGSYYANPVHDRLTDDVELKEKYPCDYSDNIWPKDDLPDMEHATKEMGKLQQTVNESINRQLDVYLHKRTNGAHKLGFFEDTMSQCFKSRLLHYFPLEEKASQTKSTSIDSFCGWHLDHSCLTVLLAPMYLDLNGNTIAAPESAGLYVKTREGQNVKVDIPEDCLAVQLGETMQFFSGGLLRATAHCVKACPGEFTREQMAMFSSCAPDFKFKLPEYAQAWEEMCECPHLPKGVPELGGRLKGAVDFADFAHRTYTAYYK